MITKKVAVVLGRRRYTVWIGSGLLGEPGHWLSADLRHTRVAIITNTTVAAYYLRPLCHALAPWTDDILPICLPDGESTKTLDTMAQIYDAFMTGRCDRKTPIIALGGGVIGDLGGFAAATYMRGVPVIQVPTTLLAQVDASIGGKTGVNHALGKNCIGAFYQPEVVVADLDTLKTLPTREYIAGLAEVIKYSLICDAPFFDWLEQHHAALLARDPIFLQEAIVRCCTHKAAFVQADECDTGLRMHLNFGHTLGHAIEASMAYTGWLHGEAVAAGIGFAVELSVDYGGLDKHSARRIRRLLQDAGLPIVPPPLDIECLMEAMYRDKKHTAGESLCFVLLRRIGEAFIYNKVSDAKARTTLAKFL